MEKTSLHIPSSRNLLKTFERVFDDPAQKETEQKHLGSNEPRRLQKPVEMEYYIREGAVSGFQPGAVGSKFDQTI